MKKEITSIPIIVNGVCRNAKLVDKKPNKSVKLNINNDFYNFYEIVEIIDDDNHYWIYAVLK